MSFWLDYVKEVSVSKVKSLAFASAAHEFRNPLNAIVASIELLEPLIDLERGYKLYTTVRNCSNLMLYLVNDILDFSQIEQKKFLLNLDLIKIEALLEDCLSVLSFKAEAKCIGLEYLIDN